MVPQMVKNPPTVQETRSQGQEDPLEKEVATHSSLLCLGNPMNRGAWWAAILGVVKSQT